MTKAKKHILQGLKAAMMLLLLALFVMLPQTANAGTCSVSYGAGNKLQPECPNGKVARTDISPKCIEDNNNNSGNCVNTMPTSGVSRVPEDVCFRGEGWSRKRPHQGMDYAAPLNAPVTAAADGVVKRATGNIAEPPTGNCNSYGNVIYIEHEGCEGKYSTRYGHLHSIAPNIKAGTRVKKGDVIGYVGGTGGACGRYHLHFEMRGPSDELINPLCDEVQKICNCDAKKTPLQECRNAKFEAGSPAEIGESTAAISSTGLNQPSEKCHSYDEVRQDYRDSGCYFCKPFVILFNTGSSMARKSFDALAGAVKTVVYIAVALWLAIITLRFVSSMEIKEPRNYVKTVLNQMFRVLIVILLLDGGLDQILYYTIDPVFMTGLRIAQTAGRISEECDLGDLTVLASKEGGLPQEMGIGILCTIKSVQDQIGDVFALGHMLVCLSFHDMASLFGLIPNFAYLISGVVIWIAAFALLLVYPFLLIDGVLKLSIAVALLPAAVGGFAFKATSKYLNKVWETFLNGMFSFIFLSIIILIISSVAADEVAKILQDRDGMNAIQRLMWWGTEFLKIAFICFLGWAVLSEAKSFTDKFASGIRLGQDIGGDTGSTALEYGAKKPGKAVLKAGGAVLGATGEFAKNVAGSYSNNIRMNANKKFAESGWGDKNAFTRTVSSTFGLARKAVDKDGNVETDEEGNVMYDTTGFIQRLRGREERTSFNKTASNIKQTSTVRDRNTHNTIKKTENDRFGKIKSRYDGKGNKISTEGELRSITGGDLCRKDGSVNMQKIETFLQNANFSKEQKELMIAQKLMQERLNSGYKGGTLDDTVTSRSVDISTDNQGRKTVTIKQTGIDHSSTVVKMTYGANNRVLMEAQTINADNKGVGFATDGIIERKSYITHSLNDHGGETTVFEHRYAFSKYYSDRTSRPLYANGDMANGIPQKEILFGKQDMDLFVDQVKRKGNKYYSFKESN